MGTITFQKESSESDIDVLVDGVKKGLIVQKEIGFQFRPNNVSVFKCGAFHDTLLKCKAQIFKEGA